VSRASGPWEQVGATRDLARRARRLAQSLNSDADRNRLLRYAEELEQQANEIEQQATHPSRPVVAPKAVEQHQQDQQLQQQQHGTGSADADPVPQKPRV
jgi:hypothetical protein